MEFLKKLLSLFLCLLIAITGPVISSALADGYGNTASSEADLSAGGDGGAPCHCCEDGLDNRRGSGGKRAFFCNGSEYLQKTDLALPGIMPILIQRTYNNQATFDSPLGYGWDFSFNDRLRTYSDNSVVIRTTTGKKLNFIFTGGVYVCEESPSVKLENNPDGSFVFYSSPAGNRYHFDYAGRLVLLQDLIGNSLRMTYSTDPQPLIGLSPNSIAPDTPMVVSNNYQLRRVEQWDSNDTSTGRYFDFSYNSSSGRLTSITDSTGRTISYHHDISGNLTRTDYPEGLFETYQYTDPNDPHNMTNNLRGYGANAPTLQTSREYDADDRMVREEYAGGVLEIDYTIPLQKTRITKTVVGPNAAVLHETDTFYEFNSAGYLLKTTDNDKSVELVRDSRNNIIEQILYRNNGTASSPNLVEEISLENVFDSENNKTRSSVYLENGETIITNYSYDNDALIEEQTYSTATPHRIHQTTFEYNHTENLPTTLANIKTLKSNNPIPAYDVVSFRYNATGQPVEMLFGNGDTVSMDYDNGLLIKNDDTILSYDNRGNVIGVEDANGHIMQYEYDDVGRNTKIINPLGEETLFTYVGWNLTRIEQGKTTEQSGKVTDFVHDDYGRLVQSSIDLSGSPVFQKTYTYDSDGNLLSVTDQQNRTNTATYDPSGHLLSQTDANSNTTTYAYSPFGQLISATNPLSQTTIVEYDKLNRPIQSTDPLGGMTFVSYDETGNVTKIIDAESREFTFGYDLAGKMIWRKNPVSDRAWYEYDSKGRVSQVTLPDGTSNQYQYNSHNQVQEVILASGTAESSTLRYGYDKVGNMLWYSDSSMEEGPLFNMTYDALNRLKTKTVVPINKTLQLAYTPQGQRENVTVLDGMSELFDYSYTYDVAGRITSLSETQQSITRTTNFSSDSRGFITDKTYFNGTTANLSYTDNGLLSNLHYSKSDNSTIEHFQYVQDALGNITEITDNLGTTAFTYDLLNRLETANYPLSSSLMDESYTFDATGNRLTSSDISDWTYDDGGKLTAYNGYTLSYDNNGRQIAETVSADTVTYSYDNLDRLTEVQQAGLQSSYNYDYNNQRLKKTVNSNSSWYLYDGANILAEFNQSGQLSRNYTYTPDTFDLLGVTEGTVANAVLTNHLQTPQYVLDSGQSILWQADYQSYGKAVINDDVDNNGSTLSINQRFPGQYSDNETGLYHNWNRSYNPATGRYISHDPIGINGGVNLYGYVGGSPLNRVDPAGLICEDWKDALGYFMDSFFFSLEISQKYSQEIRYIDRQFWAALAYTQKNAQNISLLANGISRLAFVGVAVLLSGGGTVFFYTIPAKSGILALITHKFALTIGLVTGGGRVLQYSRGVNERIAKDTNDAAHKLEYFIPTTAAFRATTKLGGKAVKTIYIKAAED